jgi:adenylyl cyclase-associated protein
MADLAKGGSTADKDGRQALFAALNKGEGITSGLKKVTADMQTHKNPNLRVQV